ncbi:MAG: electron transport complex subunit RsxC [Desulfotomaculaceae bacterium]|nr:electron transport complex subunit RsxC [Desulfotomaculaceae bacterium]
MSIFSKHLPAVHVEHHKYTADSPTEKMPVPDKVYISMAQHIGAPCQPKVAVGDLVKVGQVIGDTEAFVSAPIHSSVSGKVTAIEKNLTMSGIWDLIVTIATDKKQEVLEGLAPPQVDDKDSFIKAVRASGLVGLGGAAFPTHIKFNPKNLDEVDSFIINGAECEPYLTADYRTMMENSELLVNGLKNILKYLKIKRGIIGIESNKAPAINKLRAMVKDTPEIEVMELKAVYPQGGERVLIYETTGREIPIGKLPADIGAIVSNISSVVALETYIETGMPLIAKKVTVAGNAIRTPKNIEAPIGTQVNQLIEFCGGYKRIPRKLIMGGPMMGAAIYDDGMTVNKNTSGILAFDEESASVPKETSCINCGRCIRTCPMLLMPALLAKAYEAKDVEQLQKLNVALCMECGCCSYVCPAKKQLSFTNKLGKRLVMEGGKK